MLDRSKANTLVRLVPLEMEMADFVETSVFSKRNPELFPLSGKIFNLSISPQVQRPAQLKTELRCKGKQHSFKSRSTVPWRIGDLGSHESDLSPAAVSLGCCDLTLFRQWWHVRRGCEQDMCSSAPFHSGVFPPAFQLTVMPSQPPNLCLWCHLCPFCSQPEVRVPEAGVVEEIGNGASLGWKSF